MTRKKWLILCTIVVAIACSLWFIVFKERDTIEFDPIPIKRYEISWMTIDTSRVGEELHRLYNSGEFSPFFIGTNLDCLEWQRQVFDFITDTRSKDLLDAVLEKYPNLHWLETALGESFARYNRAFDRDITPLIFTYISHLDYDNRVIFMDSVLLIAIDIYIGADNQHLNAIMLPMYMRLRLEDQFIAVDVMRAVAHYELERTPRRLQTLLDHMILHGKVAYFLEQTLPRTDMATRFGFTPEQMTWTRRNEKTLWSYLVGEQLLFEQNLMRFRAFVQESPTVQIFPGSPGRVGHYLGYRIVKRYMENTGKTIPELFAETDSQMILRLSNYRP